MRGKRNDQAGGRGLILATLMGTVMAGTAFAGDIQREYPNPWNKSIGYAEMVQHGDTLYISGVTGEGTNMANQVTSVYEQIKALLASRGLGSSDVVKENVYTRDIEAFKAVGDIRKAFYKDEVYPAATWVQVDRLYNPEQMVEVEVEVAVKP